MSIILFTECDFKLDNRRMVLQELLQIGLGGAAAVILNFFGISYILLAICCLFIVHAISNLWIKNQTEKKGKETRINLNANTVTKEEVNNIKQIENRMVTHICLYTLLHIYVFVHVSITDSNNHTISRKRTYKSS